MDIEKKLKEFKKYYEKVEPSRNFMEQGSKNLQDRILQLEKSKTERRFYYLRPFALAVFTFFVLIVISGGLVQASQKALPGEPLYPVKRLSEDVTARISGNQVNRVENRAGEIVELSKKGKSSKQVQKAVEEYKEAVDQAKRSRKNTDDIEKRLEEHEREFEQIKKGSSGEEIDEAIEISKRGRNDEDKKKDEK
ncbi:hypothetical protein HYU95_04675 [Candidatus Daviesbacteria bacterium]|nr:hypothetical protein [Candidatus Daviesbacteria bacterium]